MRVEGMGRARAVVGAVAMFAQVPDEPLDPPAPGDITEFTRGMAHGVVDSSYDHHPQVDAVVQMPAPRVIPIQKLPIDPEERKRFRPPSRRFAAFDGISHTGWVPP